MNRIRTIGRRITLLAGLVTALLATAGAVPALASPAPPLNAGFGSAPASVAATVSGGMPGWQVALIAVGAAIAAAIAAVLADRARRVNRAHA